MDIYTIIAFVIGVAIVGAIAMVKNKKLIETDKAASRAVTLLRIALEKYSKDIKAYDRQNGTSYYKGLSDIMQQVESMVADDQISPLAFAMNVVAMYDDIRSILEDVNLFDKVAAEPTE